MLKTFLLLILTAVVSAADPITFTLLPPDLTGTPGSTVTFQYEVTNNSGATIYAAGINADPFTGGTPDASVFDAFGFAGIADGATLTGSLYAFQSDPAVASSFNSGIFDLLVTDANLNTTGLLANYSVTIASSAPEPAPRAMLLLGACVAVMSGRRLRRHD